MPRRKAATNHEGVPAPLRSDELDARPKAEPGRTPKRTDLDPDVDGLGRRALEDATGAKPQGADTHAWEPGRTAPIEAPDRIEPARPGAAATSDVAPGALPGRIAVLVADDFEDVELTRPVEELRAAGYRVTFIGKEAGATVTGKRGDARVAIEGIPEDYAPDAFQGLLVPGGFSPDRLRTDPSVVDFLRAFAETGRPIAAICHGPQLLIEAELVRGRTVTAYPSVRTDLRNAGATVVDRPVVQDGSIITARVPDDLEGFDAALIVALERSRAERVEA